jgi:phosphoribosylformimino-5-aminoimidazole carboxamide ribonucleotide (ProFAR) isomerase
VERLADQGVDTFEVTAIDRDGLLEGPDLPLYRRLVDLGRGAIVASGGIATIGDVLAVRRPAAPARSSAPRCTGRFDITSAIRRSAARHRRRAE